MHQNDTGTIYMPREFTCGPASRLNLLHLEWGHLPLASRAQTQRPFLSQNVSMLYTQLAVVLGLSLAASLTGERVWADGPVSSSTERFESFAQRWTLLALGEAPFYSFYLGQPDIQGSAFLPNFHPRLGPSVRYQSLGVTLTLPLPIPAEEEKRRGETDATSLILTPFGRKLGFDIYYQRYRGFYEDQLFNELASDKPERFAQLPDARVENYGINAYYLLSPERYSLAAAFTQSEFQKLGGGSWIIAPFYNHLKINTGDKFVLSSDSTGAQSGPNIKSVVLNTLGAGYGYGHTWVKNRRYLVLQGVLGAGVQYQETGKENSGVVSSFNLALKFNANASAGYNFSGWLTGVRLLADAIQSDDNGVALASSLLSLQAFVGTRF